MERKKREKQISPFKKLNLGKAGANFGSRIDLTCFGRVTLTAEVGESRSKSDGQETVVEIQLIYIQ